MPTPLGSANALFTKSGPYHRIWSNLGFDGVESTVHLPPKDAVDMVIKPPHTDVAFVFLGGWGEGAHAVDAGLQHSPNDGGEWSLVVLSETTTGRSWGKGNGRRFPAGTSVRLRFEVVGTNRLRVSAWPLGVGDSEVRLIEWGAVPGSGTQDFVVKFGDKVLESGSAQGVVGWRRGGSQVFKRMVSIGQSRGVGQPITDLGTGSRLPEVRWSDTILLSGDGDVAWAIGERNAHSFPKSPTFRFVSAVGESGEETVTIELDPTFPKP